MTAENKGFSRRKLLKAGAVGVPTAGLLAFGSTLVTAAPANAISADGWWGSETSAGLQRFMNAVMNAGLVVDGVISSQPAREAARCPGIVGGWEWVEDYHGSPTILAMQTWLKLRRGSGATSTMNGKTIRTLQQHYGISPDARLDAPSQTIKALQNEINQWVGYIN